MSKYGILLFESFRVEQSVLFMKIERSDTILRYSKFLDRYSKRHIQNQMISPWDGIGYASL
jgi:hypothetical protein